MFGFVGETHYDTIIPPVFVNLFPDWPDNLYYYSTNVPVKKKTGKFLEKKCENKAFYGRKSNTDTHVVLCFWPGRKNDARRGLNVLSSCIV